MLFFIFVTIFIEPHLLARYHFFYVFCFLIFYLFVYLQLKVLKRASSVPSRVEDENTAKSEEAAKSPSSSQPEGLTPSTTDESVKGSSALLDPLLRPPRSTSDSSQSHDILPQIPNVTPVRGHINFQGWL